MDKRGWFGIFGLLALVALGARAQVAPYCYGCHTLNAPQTKVELISPFTPLKPLLGEALLSPEALKKAAKRYAELCAGCHGGYREGAIGRPLLPEEMAQKGLPYLEAVIAQGLPGGMPDYRGRLSQEEIRNLARFLTYPQLPLPELSLQEIAARTKVHVPPEARPKAPERPGWENTFGVVLRDVGRIAFYDGKTRVRLAFFDLRNLGEGGWPHQLHASSNGRYFLVPGQDGNVWLVGLWSKEPTIVAETRACYEARAAEFSKAPGFEDRYILVGCYTPMQLVILDGATLKPLKLIPIKVAKDGKVLPRTRTGYISGSKRFPVWVVQLKDPGETWIVDYSALDKGRLDITRLEVPGVPALHDGGWLRLKGPEDQRYAMVVSFPQGDQVVAIDVKERKVAAIIPTGAQVLHAGRGINFDHPVYGHLWATTAAGGELVVIGADPGKPEYLWKVVKKVKLPYPGSLYGKTHPNSPWIIVDFTKADDDPKARATLCAVDKVSLEVARCFEVPGAQALNARLVQPEFNKEGTEFWIAAWTDRLTPGFLAIYDAKTLEPKGRIGGADFLSPLAKFNAYNTAHYIY